MLNDLHATTFVCRYVLLLKAMLDFTSPERSDYVVIQAAITKVKGYTLKQPKRKVTPSKITKTKKNHPSLVSGAIC